MAAWPDHPGHFFRCIDHVCLGCHRKQPKPQLGKSQACYDIFRGVLRVFSGWPRVFQRLKRSVSIYALPAGGVTWSWLAHYGDSALDRSPFNLGRVLINFEGPLRAEGDRDLAVTQYVAMATSSPCWRSRQSQSARTKFAIPLAILGCFAPGVALSQPVAAECWHDGAQSRKCYLQSPVTDRATVAPSRR
jgi:hypothetical protein